MRFDKFTTKLQEALAQAQSLALGQDNQYIEPQHLLAALLEDEGIAGLIAKAGGNPNALKKSLADRFPGFPRWKARPASAISRASSRSSSTSPTRKRRSAATSTSLPSSSCSPPRATRARREGSAIRRHQAALEKAIQEVRGGEGVSSQQGEEQRQALAKYTGFDGREHGRESSTP